MPVLVPNGKKRASPQALRQFIIKIGWGAKMIVRRLGREQFDVSVEHGDKIDTMIDQRVNIQRDDFGRAMPLHQRNVIPGGRIHVAECFPYFVFHLGDIFAEQFIFKLWRSC